MASIIGFDFTFVLDNQNVMGIAIINKINVEIRANFIEIKNGTKSIFFIVPSLNLVLNL